MKKSLPAISVPADLPMNLAGECKTPHEHRKTSAAKSDGQRAAGLKTHQTGKLHSQYAGYMAFGAAVFVSVMAAATVASHDMPLMLGGF